MVFVAELFVISKHISVIFLQGTSSGVNIKTLCSPQKQGGNSNYTDINKSPKENTMRLKQETEWCALRATMAWGMLEVYVSMFINNSEIYGKCTLK